MTPLRRRLVAVPAGRAVNMLALKGRGAATRPTTMNTSHTLLVITAGIATLALQGCSVTTTSEPYAAHRWRGQGSAAGVGWGHAVHLPSTNGYAPAPPPPAMPATLGAAPPPPPGQLHKPEQSGHAQPGLTLPGHALPGHGQPPHGKPAQPGQPGKLGKLGKLGKPGKPDLGHRGKSKASPPNPQSCIAATKAAQAGLCDQAWALLASCSDNQHQATEKRVARYCSAS